MTPRRALVTRPLAQALDWCERLRALGVDAQALPLIDIAASPDVTALAAWFSTLAGGPPRPAALVMFVSPNAAQSLVDALPPGWQWPASLLAAATGPGTVAVLRAAGVPADLVEAPPANSPQFDSETLWLRLAPRRDWAGQRVAIVRGEGGRDWLAERLREQGAQVEFVQSYARRAPLWDAAQRQTLDQALAAPNEVCWLLSSSEAVDHLATLAPGANLSASLALASHPRIAEAARRLGFGQVTGIRPTPQAVADALKRHVPT